MGIEWISTQGDPKLVFGVLGAIALLCTFIIVGTWYYQRWKKHRRFIEELNQLSLEEAEGNALINIVKRHAMSEPVEVLYSLRVFDELAEKEMNRILSLQGSQEIKQKYIDLLYTIRQKTYFPDLSNHAPNSA